MPSFFRKLLPRSLKDKIRNRLLGYNWLETTYFSQNGEDIILRWYFRKKAKGFFVDIGAYEPVALSNTFYFYSKGWRGINIEPNPDTAHLFRQLRPEDINLQMGVAEKAAILNYHIIADKAFENSFSEQKVTARGNLAQLEKVVQVEVRPLANILDEYLPKGQNIDFLTVDVEGLNSEVLISNNWQKYHPELVLVEKDASKEKNDQVISFMQGNNYRLEYDIFGSYFFVKG